MKDLTWKEKFAWYHFNYREIYEYTEEDFAKVAKAYAEQGITTVITFGMTHFMMTFEPWWEDIFACIGRLVRAFHRHGIKVVEHRSYSLAARDNCVETWYELPNFVRYLEWPGLKERILTDYTIRGVRVSSMSQVDGRTGQPQLCHYRAHCLCCNNPDYLEIARYLAGRIMDIGVGGMMNDDIQFHANACACEHCRRKFKEETGFDLPDPDHWADFYENYNDPVYVAWKLFKVRSTTRFLEEIVAVERTRGVKMLRPCYISTILDGNWTSTSVETGIRHYMNYFQENCNSLVIRYSYQNFMIEAVDRYARAERFGIPSMSLFYPYTPPLVYFCWAQAHCWGQMYTGTVTDKDITGIERPFREFEDAHAAFLGTSRKCADLAIYQSILTRDCRPVRSSQPTRSLLMASCFSGLMTDMALEEDPVEQLLQYPRIVVNCAEMLTGEQIGRLRAYAEQGGTLLLIGPCGKFTEQVIQRDPNEVARAFGLTTSILPCGETTRGIFTYGGVSVPFDRMHTTCRFDAADGVLMAGDLVLGVAEPVGAGAVLWLLPELDDAPIDNTPFEKFPHIELYEAHLPHPTAEASVIPLLRKTTGALLRAMAGTPNLTAVCPGSDLLASAFRVDAGYAIHLVNISQTFTETQKTVWHEDPLLGFDGGYRIPTPIELCLAYDGPVVPTVTLYSPELEHGVSLQGSLTDGSLSVTIPADLFGGYALLEVREGDACENF